MPADGMARFLNLPLPPRTSNHPPSTPIASSGNGSNGSNGKVLREAAPANAGAVTSVAPAPTPAPIPAQAAAPVPTCLGFTPMPERNGQPRLDHNGRIKLTLRLDPCRHRKLKLLAAQLGDSVQEILCAALDGYMRQVAADLFGKRCVCLAGPERFDSEAGAHSEDSQLRATEIVERM